MKKLTFLFATVIAVYLVLPSYSYGQKYSYEGTTVCSMCHKTEKQGLQLKIWQDSKHSQAYKALQTAKADEIAKAKTGKKAVDSPECLKCHATNVEKSLQGAKFKIEDGVQCETCHGPGSAYKSIKVMKVEEDAVKNGLIIHKDIEKYCKTCHNAQSPTFKEFKFAEMWGKIKHVVPKS